MVESIKIYFKGKFILRKKLRGLLGLLACLSLTACGSGSMDQTAETKEPKKYCRRGGN